MIQVYDSISRSLMRVLTALTIVLAIPTLVASFYGMNVALPGQKHGEAF